MQMTISRGKIISPQKVVIYGPEGIGKSTFASQFPDPMFIDTEGSTKEMDVARLPNPSSWSMLMDEIRHVKSNPGICKTLVIDTADWAERLCMSEICAKYQKSGIEDFGYGKGYVYLAEEYGRMLNLLGEIIDLGINIVNIAHAQMRKFEQPDEMGSYDRWEMKLEKKTSPMLKEWADIVLFVNYKTHVVKSDDKKNKAQGGKRVIYTSHHACWDAKNRHGLPEELPLDFSAIAHCILRNSTASQATESSAASASENTTTSAKPLSEIKPESQPALNLSKPDHAQPATDLMGIPKPLADLMVANGVTSKDIQEAVAKKGYYPEDTPISNYDPNFISGVLVAAWPQVHKIIIDSRPTPF